MAGCNYRSASSGKYGTPGIESIKILLGEWPFLPRSTIWCSCLNSNRSTKLRNSCNTIYGCGRWITCNVVNRIECKNCRPGDISDARPSWLESCYRYPVSNWNKEFIKEPKVSKTCKIRVCDTGCISCSP